MLTYDQKVQMFKSLQYNWKNAPPIVIPETLDEWIVAIDEYGIWDIKEYERVENIRRNTLKLTAIHRGERAAGIRPFTEYVTITFHHDGMLNDQENRDYWKESVKNYFDCDQVLGGHLTGD